ncbi:hypothetical protein CYMTET_22196 [Cymbomonas tetramitiformis]|uniref:Survival protein SurE-like phosphatase/nucleotidase domain-containing protein n=1 Tax=Cymbomonas tetramitiformis TaxID=36881 RepID=A0AAE0L2F6_9CHLO|nr:hypothetical protein CYMTET_22196 [Cymbomonas tetramitiformis]|eukprot:gene22192-26760_t
MLGRSLTRKVPYVIEEACPLINRQYVRSSYGGAALLVKSAQRKSTQSVAGWKRNAFQTEKQVLGDTERLRILVTNDDGVDSALLAPFLDELAQNGPLNTEVKVLVPDRERSWSSKVMTTRESLSMSSAQKGEHDVHTLTGTPADCAAVGCYHMFGDAEEQLMPHLVISGINIGANFGTGFTLSSGTVGAAIEGAIASIPSVAFSLTLERQANNLFDKGELADAPGASQAATKFVCAAVEALRMQQWPRGVDVLNINFPVGVDGDTPHRLTRVARSKYICPFQEQGIESSIGSNERKFRHRPLGMEWEDMGDNTDRETVKRGEISVVPLRLDGMLASDREDRKLPSSWYSGGVQWTASLPPEA